MTPPSPTLDTSPAFTEAAPTEPASAPANSLTLPGLDGTNPLGYLAALGLFSVLARHEPTARLQMAWQPLAGTWVPNLRFPDSPPPTVETILDHLTERLSQNIGDHPTTLYDELETAAQPADDDADTARRRRTVFVSVAQNATLHDRHHADLLAAIASDAAKPEAICQLQTTRRDYHANNIRSVLGRTQRDHLRRAIAHTWDYADSLDNQSLHLDPSEDRRHAYQWHKPSGDPTRKDRGGMLGANRLAIEAFGLFPSVCDAEDLRTTGFTGTKSHNTCWSWPIWNRPIGLAVVRTLLGLADLQHDTIPTETSKRLQARGIVAVFRSRRILVGKTPNFTPPRQVAG